MHEGRPGVNVDPSTGWTNAFIQIDNSYIGQVHQAATGIWCQDWAFQVAKNIMVVDDDINIFDLNQLAWAFATVCIRQEISCSSLGQQM